VIQVWLAYEFIELRKEFRENSCHNSIQIGGIVSRIDAILSRIDAILLKEDQARLDAILLKEDQASESDAEEGGLGGLGMQQQPEQEATEQQLRNRGVTRGIPIGVPVPVQAAAELPADPFVLVAPLHDPNNWYRQFPVENAPGIVPGIPLGIPLGGAINERFNNRYSGREGTIYRNHQLPRQDEAGDEVVSAGKFRGSRFSDICILRSAYIRRIRNRALENESLKRLVIYSSLIGEVNRM
jgi:hypothetical protein